ncbi:HPP family protein [Pseudomonas oryzae]|uniref:CBS domain-containing membrane protein n=1 Tax=Pseudomonas oryzae TaxID=1392877 RepID=A0A1H1U917_9PSED|nr:HPP family protein [Pseudomonas oryzae]SDS68992.1 CBS domain-containing membrane protein [Pseudomonas oryzae]
MSVRRDGLLARILPPVQHTRPMEWLRAALGAALGTLVPLLLCGLLFGQEVALCLLGPLGASAVLLFAVASGALSQPWSILGSYLCAALVAIVVGLLHLPALATLLLALGGALLAMYALRCLHPPAAAVALSLAQGHPTLAGMGFAALAPVLLCAGALLGCALLFNNLTGVRYPKAPVAEPAPPEPARPDVWVGITAADLQRALEEFGEFVDVTPEDLEEIVLRSERHALQRSFGEVFGAGEGQGGERLAH